MVSPKYSRISSTGRNENNKEQSSIDSNIHSNSNSKTTTDQSLHFSCFNNQSHTMTKLTNQTMTRGIIPSSVACVASVSVHTKTFSIFDRARIGGQKSKVFVCSSYARKRLLRRLHHLMHDDSSLDSEDDYHLGSRNGQSPTTVFLKTPHPDDHTRQPTVNPGFKPFTKNYYNIHNTIHNNNNHVSELPKVCSKVC